MSERRNSRRVTFYCEAHLEGIDVSHANVRLADLSVDGAFVDARTVLPPGAVARLRFTLLEREVSALAEVRYSMPGMGMGLRFKELSPEARDLIARFVEGQ
jgi:hypothetical protein